MQNANLMENTWAHSTGGNIGTYMSARELHGGVTVNVGEQTQAEALRVGGVREAVHGEGGLGGVEGLSHPLVQLVVGDGAPKGRLAVGYRLEVCTTGTEKDQRCAAKKTQKGQNNWKLNTLIKKSVVDSIQGLQGKYKI